MYEILQASKRVTDDIDNKVKQLEEALGGRHAKNFEEYCGMCGEIRGLLTARSFLTDLTKNMEKFDE